MGTKTIGSGGGRDYGTFTAFESDWDNGAVFSASEDVTGELYNDSTFDENFLANGGGTLGLNSVTITVPAGERGDGTAGSGARLVATTSRRFDFTSTVPITMEWFEWDWNGNASATGSDALSNADHTIQNCILHDWTSTGNNKRFILALTASTTQRLYNNIMYNHDSGAGIGVEFVRSTSADVVIYNCTFYNSSDVAVDLDNNSASTIVKNCIAVTCTSNCFELQASNVHDYNLSSDTTASGGNSQTSKTAVNQFVSISAGVEDLHLKSGADAIDASTDLGATASVDIDGRDRNIEGDVWDTGAHEFVSAAADPAAGSLALMGVGV